MRVNSLWKDSTKKTTFETQKMEGNLSLHILRQSPVSFDVNANLQFWLCGMRTCHRIATYCSGLRKTLETESNEIQVETIRKKPKFNT